MEKEDFSLEFGEREFPCREVWFDGDWNLVATTDLSKVLLADDNWVSDEARRIDEEILFFVEPDEIRLPSNELVKILKNNID